MSDSRPEPRRAFDPDEAPLTSAGGGTAERAADEPVVVKSRDGSRVVARRAARRRYSWRTVLGAFLVAFGLSMLGWIGWQYWGTNITANQSMSQERQELRKAWQSGPTPTATGPGTRPVPGDAMALLRIPALGNDYEVPIIAGTEASQLARGVGWYTSTALPGQVGNFAIAGHRITHGEPFARVMQLKAGDKVIVETRQAIYTYELTSAPADLTVKDTEGSWVLWPVPDKNKPGAQPTQAIITLTTCTDLFASPDRSVGFGKLIETKNK